MDKKMKLGFRGILNCYTVKRNIFSCKSILLAVVSFVVCVWLYHAKDLDFIYSFLGKISDVLIGSIPDLLGFCIGGYAIIVAINGLEKTPAIINPQQDKGNMSYYHLLSADFALTLVVMCTLLLLSYLTKLLVDLELVSSNATMGNITNLFLIGVLLWAGALTILMIMATVANLFSTSIIIQATAMVAAKDKEKEDNNNTEEAIYKVESWLGTFTVKRLEKKKK